MVTDQTREAVWMALGHSARWARYYGTLTSRYRRLESGVRFVLLVSVMGSVTTFIATTPRSVQIGAGIVVALVLAVDFVLRPAQKAAVLGMIREECDLSKTALRELWLDQANVDDDEALRRLTELNRRLELITAKDPTPQDDRVNDATSRAVYAEMEAGHVS